MLRTQPGEASGSDFNLPLDLYTPVKPLGKGGTGSTWLFTNAQTGEPVAIKFLQRPLPRILHQSILREFMVRWAAGSWRVLPLCEACCCLSVLCCLPSCGALRLLT